MGIREDLIAENAAHDPYGFKSKGENSPKHAFVSEPYEHQEFPKILYKGKETRAVQNDDELSQAESDGFGLEPTAESADVAGFPLVEPIKVAIVPNEPIPAQSVSEEDAAPVAEKAEPVYTEPSGDIEYGHHGDIILPPAEQTPSEANEANHEG